MNEDQFSGLMALLERIALALEGKPKVNLYSGPRHNGQHGAGCLVCHPNTSASQEFRKEELRRLGNIPEHMKP